MEEIKKDYKQEVAQTRTGSLGSSDGAMMMQIANLGYVPKSAYKRMAVCKGLIEQTEIPHTAAVAAGDAIEMAIYDHLAAKDPRYISNELWVSKKYSRKNVRLIAHPDIILKDDARKTLYVYEVKTTKYDVMETKDNYRGQLWIEYTLGKEIAKTYGDDWCVKLFLVHYSTDGLDLNDGITFDPTRMTLKEIKFTYDLFNVGLVMDIVDGFLETFDAYYEGDEVDADLLPAKVKEEFAVVANMLQEINDKQAEIDAFKERLYKFMFDHGVKSVKNDVFSISLVLPSESKSFDSKTYLADLAKEHPRNAKKIINKYTKTTQKKGYCSIKLKEPKDN